MKKDKFLEYLYWGSYVWNFVLCVLIPYFLISSNLKTWEKWVGIISADGFIISMSILVGYIKNNKENVDKIFDNYKTDDKNFDNLFKIKDTLFDFCEENEKNIKKLWKNDKINDNNFKQLNLSLDEIKTKITNLENRIKN